jgi:predicted MFS family arabinose efflux permease
VVLMVVTLTSGGFMTYLPIARPNGALATVALLVWGAAGALGRWRVGMVADKAGLRRLLPNSSVVSIVGIVIVFVGLPTTGAAGWALILIGGAILGVGFGSTQNLTLVAAFARARQRETAAVSSIWNIGFDTGTAAGAGIVGALIPLLDVPGAMVVPVVLIAASMPLAIRSGRPPSDDDNQGD